MSVTKTVLFPPVTICTLPNEAPCIITGMQLKNIPDPVENVVTFKFKGLISVLCSRNVNEKRLISCSILVQVLFICIKLSRH